ncbi:GNAT family N-acetyltransferase [Enterovibrio nigricans]|uniref:Ribosomal-protein-alanine N-acetyltransferase n=1 Tax=Enterovibrio nigricans DSM 22720 TaxID=1121868 RepID=A0A1T4VWR9_9GAMM|nr:GNAT family N-acetyltransferase [Enterovibrio nigricans]PKF49235.1 N-acetyltransferase [Enterovibrio nigricans]SKA68931.1 ribosomal-protein-alanine N-acetyltransferase [Enterovibrio nigricans DSM 22720]
MSSFSLTPLSLDHCPALLDFEIRNKAWFEQHIPARPAHFFDLPGLTRATRQSLDSQSPHTHLMFVVENAQKQIIARANINEVFDDHAVIGYRVCERETGKGIATKAVTALLDVCRHELTVDHVIAKTTSQNIGSQKVLRRAGFICIGKEKNGTLLHHRYFDLLTYQFRLR